MCEKPTFNPLLIDYDDLPPPASKSTRPGLKSAAEKPAEEELRTLLLRSLLAGGLAGCVVDAALFPLDTAKTRLQARRGLWQGRLYAGLQSEMLASFPCAATFWATYNTAKWALADRLSGASLHLTSACLGSVAMSLVRAPFEVVKQQLQVGHHCNSSSALLSILTRRGLFGLFAGLDSLILRELPFDAIQFLIYEHLRSEDSGLASHLLHGAVAGGCAAFLTCPIDVVKTRLMTQTQVEYSGVVNALGQIYRTEGVAGLWRGCGVRLLYTSLGGLLMFGTFEMLTPLLQQFE